jgi:hypothetical protein
MTFINKDFVTTFDFRPSGGLNCDTNAGKSSTLSSSAAH